MRMNKKKTESSCMIFLEVDLLKT